MENRFLLEDKLDIFLAGLGQKYQVIAPVEEEGAVLFKPWQAGQKVSLRSSNSVVPPKDFFFPQTETMFKFNAAGNWEIEQAPGIGPRVILGMRPCDIMSLKLLDPVFTGEKFNDVYYRDKRDNTIIIGVSCEEVNHNCFCTAYGNSPVNGEGADLHLTWLGDGYLVEVLTERGKELVESQSGLFAAAAGDAVNRKEEKGKQLANRQRSVDISGVKEKLDNMFEHPYWEEIAPKCLGCGACTYVCPTCHCFDIVDHVSQGYEGERFRCWDSCMFADFTCMAGGHNPRPSKKERVRNRFLHKLKYHNDRYNLPGCVGCGRCLSKCPVNMDITRIISDVKGVK